MDAPLRLDQLAHRAMQRLWAFACSEQVMRQQDLFLLSMTCLVDFSNLQGGSLSTVGAEVVLGDVKLTDFLTRLVGHGMKFTTNGFVQLAEQLCPRYGAEEEEEEEDNSMHVGAAIHRMHQVGSHTCETCSGTFRKCSGSYGYRSANGKGTWETGTKREADMTYCPESPNEQWCSKQCEIGGITVPSSVLLGAGKVDKKKKKKKKKKGAEGSADDEENEATEPEPEVAAAKPKPSAELALAQTRARKALFESVSSMMLEPPAAGRVRRYQLIEQMPQLLELLAIGLSAGAARARHNPPPPQGPPPHAPRAATPWLARGSRRALRHRGSHSNRAPLCPSVSTEALSAC